MIDQAETRVASRPPINTAVSNLVEEVDMLGNYIERLTDRLGYVLNEDQTVSADNYKEDTVAGNSSTMLLEVERIITVVRAYRDRVGRLIDRLEV
jgi:hypothetical protein